MRFSKYLKKSPDICIQTYRTSKGRTTQRQITLRALIKSIGFQYPCFHCFNKQRVEIFSNDSELLPFSIVSVWLLCLSLPFLFTAALASLSVFYYSTICYHYSAFGIFAKVCMVEPLSHRHQKYTPGKTDLSVKRAG